MVRPPDDAPVLARGSEQRVPDSQVVWNRDLVFGMRFRCNQRVWRFGGYDRRDRASGWYRQADLIPISLRTLRWQRRLHHALARLLLCPVATRGNWNVVATANLRESNVGEAILLA